MQKKQLLIAAKKAQKNLPLTPHQISSLVDFERGTDQPLALKLLQSLAVPFSLILGVCIVMFPNFFVSLTNALPTWTNLSPQLVSGIDYIWNTLSEPVDKANIMYHLPNIILFSFGVLGIKKLLDAVDRRTWLDIILDGQQKVLQQIQLGNLSLQMEPGHSLLFVGNGDFIGTQFTLNHKPSETVTIAESKPSYTNIWNQYTVDSLYDSLTEVLKRSDGRHAGEYIFFPVKDDQIFLPGEKAYDLSPHKLDILCQNIRKIEQQQKWKAKRIIIIGDKYHRSIVQSVDNQTIISGTKDIISLQSIAKKYKNVSLLDPTDIVLTEIVRLAEGRKIALRATKDGIHEYKKRFYARLIEVGYKQTKKRGTVTVGYDLFEDQTEQQTLDKKSDYIPVVLSKNVRDALLRNGYKKSEFLYVPDLVLRVLNKQAAEQ